MTSNSLLQRKNFLLVLISASAMLLVKLIYSSSVYGTNDVTYYIGFSDIIQKFGTFKIYSLVPIYNHPPLVSWFIKLIKLIQINTNLSFPFLFRLLPVFLDYTSIFVIWELLKVYKIKNKVLICLLCIINPINFLVSAFHGNTDPVFVFIILLAIYFAENKNFKLCGLLYGLSICIKIAPIILLPTFIFYIKDEKDKIFFFLSALILPSIIFLPYLFKDYYSLIRNIFLYSSLKGVWGLGHILFSIFKNENISIPIRDFAYAVFRLHIALGVIIFFIFNIFLTKFLISNNKLNLTEGTFLTFCLFLTITPGFGVQYLSWISLYAIISSFTLGMFYVLIGGFFLYRVYAYWSGGLPLYYANSDKIGQWVGFEKKLDIIVWFIIVIMLIKFILDKRALIPRDAFRLPLKIINTRKNIRFF